MKVELIISEGFLSHLTAEIVELAVKTIEREHGEKIELITLHEEDVKYPVIKVSGFPPIVVKSPPSLSELVNMINLALDLSRLSSAPNGMSEITRADTLV